MKTETKPYNPVRFFRTDAELGAYLSEAFLDEDPNMFIVALGHVARHKGLAKLAEETGLNRESLYKALSGKTRPRWDTVQRILKALHVDVHLAA